MSKKEKVEKVESFKLFKPNGMEVEVNERSLKYALSLGWTEEKPKAEWYADGQMD